MKKVSCGSCGSRIKEMKLQSLISGSGSVLLRNVTLTIERRELLGVGDGDCAEG